MKTTKRKERRKRARVAYAALRLSLSRCKTLDAIGASSSSSSREREKFWGGARKIKAFGMGDQKKRGREISVGRSVLGFVRQSGNF